MSLDYQHIVQFFFPPSEDERILQATDTRTFTNLYEPHIKGETVVLLPYQVPAIRAAIHLNKFHHHQRAQHLLANILHQYLATRLQPVLLIPIPLSRTRERTRGYNQVTEIIKKSQYQKLGHTLQTRLLKRTRHTAPQTSLPKSQRLLNLTDAFTYNARFVPVDVVHTDIILIDDVLTTGATLKAARASLAPLHPASITCLALAH